MEEFVPVTWLAHIYGLVEWLVWHEMLIDEIEEFYLVFGPISPAEIDVILPIVHGAAKEIGNNVCRQFLEKIRPLIPWCLLRKGNKSGSCSTPLVKRTVLNHSQKEWT